MLTRGRIRVTLRAGVDVDDMGFVNRTGVGNVWAGLVGVPEGVEVIVDLGPTKHVSRQILDLCSEHLGMRQTIVFESRDPAVAAAWVEAGR